MNPSFTIAISELRRAELRHQADMTRLARGARSSRQPAPRRRLTLPLLHRRPIGLIAPAT